MEYILAILLLQIDINGGAYNTPFVEEPRKIYNNIKDCLTAAENKRYTMLQSAKKYPDLEIVDIKISCVPIESGENI
jgi:hypothetical protein